MAGPTLDPETHIQLLEVAAVHHSAAHSAVWVVVELSDVTVILAFFNALSTSVCRLVFIAQNRPSPLIFKDRRDLFPGSRVCFQKAIDIGLQPSVQRRTSFCTIARGRPGHLAARALHPQGRAPAEAPLQDTHQRAPTVAGTKLL
eukprot:EG_transcript_5464